MNKHLLWIGLFLFFQLSFGQETVRPKVGLVLSGGGAKGLAHIGVLKTLDSLNIKVDYIAGTSMGAVVGGLYASGYSAKQLDSIFSKLDVNALLQDYTPRESKSFYEKRNDEIYALTLPFSNFKLGLPSGLSKGLYNFNLISRLTKHVSHIREFNQLPIPFLCIATDLETGNQVVLEKGILAEAIIASGALPTLYNPIEFNVKAEAPCPVATYATCRNATFGVESFNLNSGLECGAELFNDQHDCRHCGQVQPFRDCRSCRHESHGVERYNTCRHENFGVENHKLGSGPICGVASFQACSHPSFGIARRQACPKAKF